MANASDFDAASTLMGHARAAFDSGDLGEAERLCRDIVAQQPHHYGGLNLLGIIAVRAGRSTLAIDLFSQAVSADPNRAMAHNNLGLALQSCHRLEQALTSFDNALALDPNDADAHYMRSMVLGSLGRHDEALRSSARALVIRPGFVEALNSRGLALARQQRMTEALESFDQALAIKSDYAEAFNNRGNTLKLLNRLQEALASYEQALALQPEYADAEYNRGIVLSELAQTQMAIASYTRVLALNPDYAGAHWNLALCMLQSGDFSRGWIEHEWRWREAQMAAHKREFTQPLWLGDKSLAGKTVLLHAEGGLGDTLQFCRYVKRVAALDARVVLEVPPLLMTLLADLEGVQQVVCKGDRLPAFDFHCPLMSLPLAFRTEIPTIPADIPYLKAGADRVAVWQGRLGTRLKPRIGLAWSGNLAHVNDRNRSLALSDLLPLIDDRAEWISLQKDVRPSDAAALNGCREIRHYGQLLNDFTDTAALVALVDLVITVDTSVAHLAGAMGKPVWILLPFSPDWRWLLGRDDSPWYPTARLFRQSARGDWAGAIAAVRDALAATPPNLHAASGKSPPAAAFIDASNPDSPGYAATSSRSEPASRRAARHGIAMLAVALGVILLAVYYLLSR